MLRGRRTTAPAGGILISRGAHSSQVPEALGLRSFGTRLVDDTSGTWGRLLSAFGSTTTTRGRLNLEELSYQYGLLLLQVRDAIALRADLE